MVKYNVPTAALWHFRISKKPKAYIERALGVVKADSGPAGSECRRCEGEQLSSR